MVRQRIRKTLLLISFLLLPVTLYYFLPYLILMAAAEGIVAGSFIAFTLTFLASLVLGRAFCGWVCPIGGLGEICATIHEKRVNSRRADWVKYVIWVPWVALIAFTVVRAGGLRAVDGLYQTSYGISLIEPYAYVIYLTVIALVVVLSFTVGKRGFCHAVHDSRVADQEHPAMALASSLCEQRRLHSVRKLRSGLPDEASGGSDGAVRLDAQ